MTLQERTERFRKEFDMPATKFCQRINLSVTGYARWRKGNLNLSEEKEREIENYIGKYGF